MSQEKYIGMDVHQATISVAVMDAGGKLIMECLLETKASAHGQGFGREVVAALVEWGRATLRKGSFIYPVAVQNTASRRIAENLHGEIIGNRTNPKYDSVVYRIPFYESPYPS
jgi:RimJ/RimL family protein N-acetyltransferase